MPDIYQAAFPKIAAKTAAYRIHPNDHGTLFTNRGATGAVTLTLPYSGWLPAGWRIFFAVVADQSLTITQATGDTDQMVVYNDIAADSIAVSTSAKKLGASGEIIWDGTGWLTLLNPQNDATNYNLFTLTT